MVNWNWISGWARILGSAAAVLCFAVNSAWAEDRSPADEGRRYEHGPLKVEEFQAVSGPQQDRMAYTATRIFYRFRYQVEPDGDQMVASLTSLDVHAAFMPQESWWGRHARVELIDHEQGHFDIAEINARKIRLAFAKFRASGRRFSAREATAEAASQRLTRDVERLIQHVDRRIEAENTEYDRSTRHGLNRQLQSEQRHLQNLTLERLAKTIATRARHRATRQERKLSLAELFDSL